MITEFLSQYVRFIPVSFVAGFLLDCIAGDPVWFPHPVRLIGHLVSFFEKLLYPKTSETKGQEQNAGQFATLKRRGVLLVIFVLLTTFLVTTAVNVLLYLLHPYALLVFLCVLSACCIAARDLQKESRLVVRTLEEAKDGELTKARHALSLIVGRDTKGLDEQGILRATVETIAEGSCDGVVAPLFFLMLGGPVAGLLYKAVNTMDSMVGYRNERYRAFGCAAAKLDDVLNFLPARLAALGVLLFGALTGSSRKGNGVREAFRIFLRDRNKTDSPNAGQTESAMAAVLGIRLGGPAYYQGVLHDKAFLGEETRQIMHSDVSQAISAMWGTACLYVTIGVAVFIIVS